MKISIDSRKSNLKKPSRNKTCDFIAAGVACYAFSLLDELGILNKLESEQGLSTSFLRTFPNPLVIFSALKTLEANGVVFVDDSNFKLSKFGKSLSKHKGSIGLIYNGYRKVISNQYKIAIDEPSPQWELIDQIAISKAASHMGKSFFNHLLFDIIKKFTTKGSICDLGCGNAETLIYLCRHLKLPGIGFDLSLSSIKNGKEKLIKSEEIKLINQDITKINDIYPDVEIIIQSFVMHDLSDKSFKKTIKLIEKCFPNIKALLFVDAVSPELDNIIQLPGFDYIHSLFGIRPRTVSETSKLISDSNFKIKNLIPIPELPNCYIWTLCKK